jgi:predicted nucleic acid-binding protein
LILVDTSGLLAALFSDQRHHESCVKVLLANRGALILSPFVLAELDYLIGKLAGVDVELDFLDEITRGAYQLVDFSATDLEEARSVIAKYRDLDVGLADASIVVLSRRFGSLDVVTLDERHFRPMRGARGRHFRVLPADALS